MKKLILIITVGILSLGSLFAQTEKTKAYVKQIVTSGIDLQSQLHTAATVVLIADDCKNVIHFNDDADVIDFTLPACESGLAVGFGGTFAGVITVDPFDGVDKIYINGADGGAGNAMASAGDAGNYIILIALDDTRWWALPVEVNTWGIP